MSLVVEGLIVWVAVSLVLAPVLGIALHYCDIQEQLRSVAVLRAKAHHPARRVA